MRSKFHLSATLPRMNKHEKPHACRTKGQLEHQGDPGQQPGAEVLGEHRPIERPCPSATGVHAFLEGELRLASLVLERGFAFVQVDSVSLSKQTEKERAREPKLDCKHEIYQYR